MPTRPEPPDVCGLCERPLGARHIEAHHLVPKRYKGTITALIHAICHRKIHATFSEAELRDHFHTFERLRAHEDIETFVRWVAKKAPEFYDSSKRAARHPKKGKRV